MLLIHLICQGDLINEFKSYKKVCKKKKKESMQIWDQYYLSW